MTSTSRSQESVSLYEPMEFPAYALIIKRTVDLVLTVGSLPLILPMLAVLTLLIRLDSRGPAFYKDKRIGLHGVPFHCLKLRTMHLNGDQVLAQYLQTNPAARLEWEQYRKLRGHDPRITRVGKVIRRFSLDELPQLLNVLLGHMSLVGPRPYMLGERHLLAKYYAIVTSVKPGITGLWQVSGRNEIKFHDRVLMETEYVRSWSLWTDMTLLVKTVTVLINRRGAY